VKAQRLSYWQKIDIVSGSSLKDSEQRYEGVNSIFAIRKIWQKLHEPLPLTIQKVNK
jgi:hypothetical protein